MIWHKYKFVALAVALPSGGKCCKILMLFLAKVLKFGFLEF